MRSHILIEIWRVFEINMEDLEKKSKQPMLPESEPGNELNFLTQYFSI